MIVQLIYGYGPQNQRIWKMEVWKFLTCPDMFWHVSLHVLCIFTIHTPCVFLLHSLPLMLNLPLAWNSKALLFIWLHLDHHLSLIWRHPEFFHMVNCLSTEPSKCPKILWSFLSSIQVLENFVIPLPVSHAQSSCVTCLFLWLNQQAWGIVIT